MTNECKDCAMGCCGCISLLALVSGSVAYYVFAIIALVNEYHDPFSTMCNCKSHLWVYMLVFIIYTLLFSQKLSNVFQDDKSGYVEKCISFSFNGMIELGLIGWGWWELHQSGAYDGLHHLMLYKLAEVMVYLHTAFMGCLVIAFILAVVYSTDICDGRCCCGGDSSTGTPTVMSPTNISDIEAQTPDNEQTAYMTTSSPKSIPKNNFNTQDNTHDNTHDNTRASLPA